MAFISRFINRSTVYLFKRFVVSSKVVDQFEVDYPLEGMGDHHRFML